MIEDTTLNGEDIAEVLRAVKPSAREKEAMEQWKQTVRAFIDFIGFDPDEFARISGMHGA